MARSLLGAPYSAFYDNNGDPLNGGKVYTYSAGTTTPKDTYTTYSSSSVNTNPVVLDSGGRAEIWLNGAYKIAVANSSDSIIRTVDNVTSQTATGDMLASTYDAAGISQQVVGTSATQTLTNKTLVTPVLTLPSISGVINASNAASGYVGEVLESTLSAASSVSLTNNSSKTITSITLTAGDWDVWGNIAFAAAASSVHSAMIGSISTTNNTHATIPNGGAYSQVVASLGTGNTQVLPTGMTRINTSASSTAVYLVGTAAFSTSTLTAYGYIGARRVR